MCPPSWRGWQRLRKETDDGGGILGYVELGIPPSLALALPIGRQRLADGTVLELRRHADVVQVGVGVPAAFVIYLLQVSSCKLRANLYYIPSTVDRLPSTKSQYRSTNNQ